MAEAAAAQRERIKKDFGVDDDQGSVVSGLEDEVDEWAALNKYQILRTYQEKEDKKEKARDAQIRMREEL